MKKNSLLIAAATLLSISAFAQPDKKMVDEALTNKKIVDTSKHGNWVKGGTFAINIAEQTSSYWTGVSEAYSLTIGAGADLFCNYAKGKNTWDNTLKMNYALQNTQTQGVRKTSDFIDLYSKYGHLLNDSGTLAASFLVNARSQFTDGYEYDAYGIEGVRKRTSGFFAPATILVTPGIDWRPSKSFSLFFSPAAAKWVLVTNDPYSYYYPNGIKPDGSMETPLAELFGVDPARKVDFQFGAFVSAKFEKELLKNVVYSSRLDLYSNYLDKPQNIDIFWTNNLLFKVNKWLVVNYQWNVAYDDQYVPEGKGGPRTQFLGNLGIGISGKF